ncbi:MAG: GNAT family N-acetyltransferase [Pseudonocardiaceae bacterium]
MIAVFVHPLGDGGELRPLEPWQSAELLATVAAAREHLSPWTVIATRVMDLRSASTLLRRFADLHANDTGRYLGIWADVTLVGAVMFRNFDADTGVCELGAWLTPAAQGRGLVTRAFRHMIDWAFRERGMFRVELRTSPANTRCRGIAPRLGMTREGLLRGAVMLGGVRHDSEVWSILAHEWPPPVGVTS